MITPQIRTIAVIAIATLPFLYGIWWLWWRLPKRQMDHLALKIRDPKARADVEDNLRKTIGQALGGAAVLFGAGTALFQFLHQQQAAHELLISNQVSKGFEQLAGKEPVMRLGGIYALEGVMNASDQYRIPVLEALCAFVRDQTVKIGQPEEPATEVQAVLTVIGRRAKGPGDVNLKFARIPNAKLNHADLAGADLNGANLTGVRVRFDGSQIPGAGPLNLTGAKLTGANLTDADLTGVKLTGADVTGANLTRADVTGADLTGANLTGVKLTGANLTRTNLAKSHFQVNQAQLDGACGKDAKLPAGLTLKPCPETQGKAPQ